jgi:hypothetical protein
MLIMWKIFLLNLMSMVRKLHKQVHVNKIKSNMSPKFQADLTLDL